MTRLAKTDNELERSGDNRGEVLLRSLILCQIKRRFSCDEFACLVEIALDLCRTPADLTPRFMLSRERISDTCRIWGIDPETFGVKFNSLSPIELHVVSESISRYVNSIRRDNPDEQPPHSHVVYDISADRSARECVA